MNLGDIRTEELPNRLREAAAWRPGSDEVNRVRIVENEDDSFEVAIVIDGRYFEASKRWTKEEKEDLVELWRAELEEVLSQLLLEDEE